MEGAVCASGTPTGIGVRLRADSRELLIYMQGGGACTDGQTCWVSTTNAANVNGYAAAEFAEESLINSYALFADQPANPFAEMNMVMVPYCTGDGHAGNAVRELDVEGTPRTTYFKGAAKMQLYLERLAATFPDLERVYLVGTSAGGGGATFNYGRIRDALGVEVHSIIDSAPGFLDEGDQEKWAIWGVEPDCDGCTSGESLRQYNRSLAPSSRFGFLTFRFDKTTSNGKTEAEYEPLMTALLANIQADANGRTFVIDNSATGFDTTLHVITTKNNPPALRTAYLNWLTALTDLENDADWENVTLTPP